MQTTSQLEPTLRRIPALGAATFLGVLMAHGAPAQDSLQGMMSAAPAGLVTSTNNQIQVRRPGASSGPVVTWSSLEFGQPGAGRPSFDVTSFPGGWNNLRFNALSTGSDIIPMVSSTGQLQMGNLWYAYSITLEAGAQGAPGSLISVLRGRNVDLSRTVLTYYVEQSVGISPTYVGKVLVEYLPMQSGVGTGAQITSLDFGLGVNTTSLSSTGPNPSGAPTFPQQQPPVMYFTVTPAFVAANPGLYVDHEYRPGNLQLVSTGDVYSSYWGPVGVTSAYGWSAPRVAFASDELGLPAGTEIDSISVYDRSTTQTMVFSTNRNRDAQNAFFNEILVYSRSRVENGGSWTLTTLTQTTPLRTPSGATVSSKFGLAEGATPQGRDNPRSGCGWDPEATYDVNDLVAIPQHRLAVLPAGSDLGISVARVPATVALDGGPPTPSRFSIQATGLQVTPGATGEVFFFAGASGLPDPQGLYTLPTLLLIATVPVTPGADSVDHALPIDPNFSGLGHRLHVMAVLGQTAGGVFSVTQQSSFGVIRY